MSNVAGGICEAWTDESAACCQYHLATIKPRNFNKKSYAPVRVVWAGLGSKKFLLTSLVGEVSTNLVTVFFGLKEGNQVDTRPHLLPGEFTVLVKIVSFSFIH